MLTYPDFDPIIFSIGPLAIRWYGLMYVIGFVAGWLLARRRAQKSWSVVKPEQVDDLIFYCMLGVIAGGRLGYSLFYGFEYWLDDPLYVFKITQGGMSFHGGLLGVMFAMWLYGRRVLKKSMLQVTDFVAPLVPIGLGTGRIGNFINGELWGKPTDLPWAFNINGVGLHPSQLYEAFFEGLVLFVILWLYSAKPRPTMAVSGMFLLCYGMMRFGIEFVRVPDSDFGYLAFGWVTMGQLLTAPMIVGGIILLYLAYRNRHTQEAMA
ncbi:MAG: prolipoprotein diacylglyceryl transferase [Woeseiaceae bacterium]|nr:prolipoprotein diacylglyceryl transferase [Woeseiaceae bacterium]